PVSHTLLVGAQVRDFATRHERNLRSSSCFADLILQPVCSFYITGSKQRVLGVRHSSKSCVRDDTKRSYSRRLHCRYAQALLWRAAASGERFSPLSGCSKR
ncbi:unnamed protein product, partial [Sphacelaria rigidula]